MGDRLKLGWQVQSLTSEIPTETDLYQLQIQTPTGQRSLQAQGVILTVPAYSAAQILTSLSPQAADQLQQIPYPPVAVIALGYPTTALPQPLRGFGHLIPRSAGLRTLGTIWSSCLFPDRAPQGYHLLLSFIGGATDPDYARRHQVPLITEFSPAERAEIVHRELSQIVLTQSVQPQILGEKLWLRAIPQYTLGHRHRLHQIFEHLRPWPGISLCANYLDGVSLGDCVKRANVGAERVLAYLQDPIHSPVHP